MSRLTLHLILLIVTTFTCLVSFSSCVIAVEKNSAINVDELVIERLNSDHNQLSFSQVSKLHNDQWHHAARDKTLRAANQWIRFTLKSEHFQHGSEPLLLEISNPLISSIEVHLIDEQQHSSFIAGTDHPVSFRPLLTRTLLFPLPKPNGKMLTVYLNSKDIAAYSLPFRFITFTDASAESEASSITTGMLIGGLLTILMCCVYVYSVNLKRIYANFGAYIVTLLFLLLAIEGYSSFYLWPDFAWMHNISTPLLIGAACYFLITISLSILKLKSLLQVKVYRMFTWFGSATVLISLLTLVLPEQLDFYLGVTLFYLSVAAITSMQIISLRKGEQPSKLFLASFILLIAAFSLKLMQVIGLITFNPIVNNLFQIGVFAHVLVLAVQLAEEFNNKQYKRIKKQQQQIITHQRLAKDYLEQLTAHQEEQDTLEATVDERNFELNMTLLELQEKNRQLEEQATNDALTGAKNRKFFDQRLSAEYRLSRRQLTPLSMLLLDADKFKDVNDTYGHLAGDDVLVAISQIARNALSRPNDYVCRYGGEEFAILLSNTDSKGAEKVAELIRQKIESTKIKTESAQLNVTVSIGVSTIIVDAETPETALFSAADKALYQAKNSGRNQVVAA
ncbi:hypothetical protein CW748_03055 [Alteromonadales bacterium alter-6D02]|nr:hypothetical protein CW748_03055 [Alteromonadales bacterium alter-6D02]